MITHTATLPPIPTPTYPHPPLHTYVHTQFLLPSHQCNKYHTNNNTL